MPSLSVCRLDPLTLAQRGVRIDEEFLADTLKAEGLAKDYNGEGARPEW